MVATRVDDNDEHISGHARHVMSDFEGARRERAEYDLAWWTAHRWVVGDTNVFFDNFSRGRAQVYRVTGGVARSKRIRPINWIGNALDGIVGKDIKARPTFHAGPTTDEEVDKLAARAARDWLRWLWEKERLTGRRRNLFAERATTGNAFAKPWFNELSAPFGTKDVSCADCAGRGALSVVDESTGVPATYACPSCRGAGSTKSGRQALGDVAVAFIPAWEIYPLAGSIDIESAPGIIHAYKMSTEAASTRYGVDARELLGDRSAESDFESWARSTGGSELEDNVVQVIERYLPPLPGEEQPRITIVVGSKVVWPSKDMPEYDQGWIRMREPYGRIPIVHFKWRATPGRFFAEGVVLDMISSNDTVNRLRTLIHRQALTMAVDKWFYMAGSVNTESLRDIEAEAVEVYGAEYPKRQGGSPMPEFVNRLLEQEKNNIYELGHLRELDRGIAPPNIEAAQALSILAETGDTAQGGKHVEDEMVWADLARMCLVCARANYGDEQRFVRVAGESSTYEVKKFMIADITSNIDVTVDLGSALDASLALKRADVINAWNAGMLDDGEEALRLLEFGTKSETDNTNRLHESMATKESDEIVASKGAASHQVDLIDDHETHFRIHMKAALQQKLVGNMQVAGALSAAAMAHNEKMGQLIEGQIPQDQPPQGDAPAPAGVPFDAGMSGQELQ